MSTSILTEAILFCAIGKLAAYRFVVRGSAWSDSHEIMMRSFKVRSLLKFVSVSSIYNEICREKHRKVYMLFLHLTQVNSLVPY